MLLANFDFYELKVFSIEIFRLAVTCSLTKKDTESKWLTDMLVGVSFLPVGHVYYLNDLL